MKYFLSIGLFLALFTNVFAQKTQVKKADVAYEKFAYIDAIATYEKLAKKGYKTPDMLEKLGDSYYFNSRYAEAALWYSELFALQPEAKNPEYYYRYAQTLKSVEEYEKADRYLERFYQAKGDDFRGKAYIAEENYLEVIKRNSGRFTIEPAHILNSEYSDYGATVYKGSVIFASTRKGKFLPLTQKWTNQPFSVLYASKITRDGNLEKPENFSSKLDSKFNEATPVFTKDGKTIYFTRNNYLKKKGKSSDGITKLKIYRAVLRDGKWTNITELPFNNDEYNVTHPALSLDEKTLYFVSDMKGGIGGKDLWRVSINKNGTFGTPENLGAPVNTEGDEMFPFISYDNQLYFSSTGHLGLGGLDIFVSEISEKGFSEPVNVGKPVNSPMDDFGFYIGSNRKGFFSSNREGGQGYDDIYKFTELKKLICEQLIAGTITDIDTKEVLAGVEIELYSADGKLLAKTITNEQGKYTFDGSVARCDELYRVRISRKNYATDENTLKTPDKTGESELDLSLKRTRRVLAPGTDLRFILGIPDIYFDLDKSDIRPDAEIELQKILNVMTEYPDLVVDIRSHTDCRASHAYNEKLSDRRAKSSRLWLISKGIAPERLTAKGYGETQLINHCADGVDCTEEEHQQNRRSEFIVISGGE